MLTLRSCLVAGTAALAYALPPVDCAPSPQGPPAGVPESVPIAIGGKEADISIEFIALMLPEYDVVHVINNAPVGKSEFVPLLKGEILIPVSGLGSNMNNPDPRIPLAIFIGGGFSPSEIDEMYSVKSLQSVPWLYPPTATRENGTIVPPTAAIAGRVKQVFAEHGLVPGNTSNVEPGVWSF